MIKPEIKRYLLGKGFVEDIDDYWHWLKKETAHGQIHYGFYYGEEDTGLYLWSGLGDSDSYGFKIYTTDLSCVKRVVEALLNEI